jgi:hypothetical protein
MGHFIWNPPENWHSFFFDFFFFLFSYFQCFFFVENNKEAEKVEANYEKLKKCFGHGSRTGPHQSEREEREDVRVRVRDSLLSTALCLTDNFSDILKTIHTNTLVDNSCHVNELMRRARPLSTCEWDHAQNSMRSAQAIQKLITGYNEIEQTNILVILAHCSRHRFMSPVVREMETNSKKLGTPSPISWSIQIKSRQQLMVSSFYHSKHRIWTLYRR